MLYIDYIKAQNDYLAAWDTYAEVLKEKEALFDRTQPKGIDYQKDKVQGGGNTNAFDEYILAKERAGIDERLEEAKKIADARWVLMESIQQALRSSMDIEDRVFCLRFMEHRRVKEVAKMLSYSESHVWHVSSRVQAEVQRWQEKADNSNSGRAIIQADNRDSCHVF